MKSLGKFNKINLREFWPDEAKSFTPWLANQENLQLLSDEIGIDLEFEGIEVFIGNYKADIVCRDISNDQKVIIENQLEKSNHDHLGKIITYASGIDAYTVIWICSLITEEHRQAIDWLNQNTIEEIRFFAIEIELWKIDNSVPAPKFNIICKPNEWIKSTKDTNLNKVISETKLIQLEYWNFIIDYFTKNNTILRLRKPRPQHWYSLSLGKSKFSLSLTVNTIKNKLGCEVYIRGDKAKESFGILYKEKEEIERNLGTELNWQELPEGQDCRIILQRSGDILDKKSWEDSANWFFKWTEAFYKEFSERIKKIN